MKIKAFAILLLLLAVNAVSAQSTLDKWPAIKDFHAVMSATFHPAEEGNLEAVKSRSQELYDKAAALLKSDIPAEFRTNAILASAERLQTKSRALNKMVMAKASDADLTKSVTEVHNIFHEIVGLCSEEKK
jgi:Skp family chaperone for outer membrane proteins